ncbi:MAG TPA: DUF4345 domain-containing protein [Patescibacteria group bacterium]|nr:DUF4345 domain-containing protein [Patescibacteria group bacterium]
MTASRYACERRALQAAIAVGGLVPVLAGASGMIMGPQLLADPANLAVDSHFRYLSGLLFGIGIAFWYAIPTIETRTGYCRLLCLPIVIGGFARLMAAVFIGLPPLPMLLAIGMELAVTPALCAWQARIAREAKHV